MPQALIIGARNLGHAIIEALIAEGWTVTGAARSSETLDRVRALGANAVQVDVTDPDSVFAVLRGAAGAGHLDLIVNAASPYGGDRSGPFGGGTLAEADPGALEAWTEMPIRGTFGFLSAATRFAREQGAPMTVIQVTGGSARRASAGRGLWAAGAFGVRALTQAAAQELRPEGMHVALLIVDATVDRSGGEQADSAGPGDVAAAVLALAAQSPRAMTHELQITPALDRWTP